MRHPKIIFTALAASLLLGGCQAGIVADGLPIDTQAVKDGVKEAFKAEVVDFFKNDDLSDALGIDKERTEEIEKSIQGYVDSYELDEETVEDVKKAVYNVLEEAKNLSAEELDGKIADIFKNQK